MKVYVITRTLGGIVNCSFRYFNGGKPASRPQRLRHVELHSPTGFECGYGGSGPADLAASILADFFSVPAQTVVRVWRKPIGSPSSRRGSKRVTQRRLALLGAEKVIHFHQIFKADVISGIQIERGGRFELTADQIVEWLCKKENEEKTAAEAAIEDQ